MSKMSFKKGDNIIHSRDIIARIEELENLKDDAEANEEDLDELEELLALAEEGSAASSDWRYGEPLIADHYFERYARELAEDIGAIDRNATWPNNCIDWEHAARELQHDYSSIGFGAEEYWIRST